MITTVTGKNQITIPARLASDKGIHRGARLDWSATEDEDVLKVRILPDRGTLANELMGAGRSSLAGEASAVDDLIREREADERDSRAR